MATHDVRGTLGSILTGSGLAAILTGIVTTQTIYYFQHYPDDKAPIKLMVVVVWFLDILHTIMIFASDWLWLIERFGAFQVADWIPWSLAITVILTAFVTIITHSFFAYRIFGLSKGNWFVVGPIMALATLRVGFASTTCAKMLIYRSFSKFVSEVSWVFTMGLVTSSILDVVITSCLLWYLRKARTGFAGMDQIINTLSLYAIENGLLTSVAIVISLGFWLGMRKDNLIFMAIHFVVAKLYANSLLAALNNRKQLRGHRGGSSMDGPPLIFNLRRGTTLKRSMDQIGVQIDREVQITREKSLMGRDEESAGMVLSPVRYQSEVEKGSMETSSTSKSRAIVEELALP